MLSMSRAERIRQNMDMLFEKHGTLQLNFQEAAPYLNVHYTRVAGLLHRKGVLVQTGMNRREKLVHIRYIAELIENELESPLEPGA